MAYQPSTAKFELDVGSVFLGIFPASFQASVIGSTISILYVFGLTAATGDSVDFPALSQALAGLFEVFLVLLIAVIIGAAVCAFYLTLIGAPVALWLKEKIEMPRSSITALATATGAGAFATYQMFGGLVAGSAMGNLHLNALIAVYAIPAGYLYRRAIIASRNFNRLSQDET